MARLECLSAQRGVPSAWVDVDGITDAEVSRFRTMLSVALASGGQVSDAVATTFAALVASCPNANPSDLWQHVIYRHLLSEGWSDNRWKRVSGYALERAFVSIYQGRLAPYSLRMRIVTEREANEFLSKLDIEDIRSTKVDLFLEGFAKVSEGAGEWLVFGAAHVKSSIAERIQDDVPASQAFMSRGLTSVALTMDAKSYPPPHGDCVNYGELGGRSVGVEKERLKRKYVEVNGQFDGLFSYNLRTPPSAQVTQSSKRIYTMSFSEAAPDQLVQFLTDRWSAFLGTTTKPS